MSLRLGDLAPDFTQESSEGPIHFYEWAGKNWVVFFSHPADFTPVCTTELGYTAKLKPEFEKRGAKAIALSVDTVENHKGWIPDINETQGTQVNFPILADHDHKVSLLYDLIHPNSLANLTVRSVFIIDPDKKVRATITYPASTGRNFNDPAGHRFLAIDRQLQGRHPGELERRRRRGHCPGLEGRERTQGAFPQGIQGRAALLAVDAPAEQEISRSSKRGIT